MDEPAQTSAKPRSRIAGSLGAIIGMLALALAVLPVWVLPTIFPPPPVENVIVDTAARLKQRVIAKAQGVEYREARRAVDPAESWARICSIGAVSLGLAAIGCAVFSLLRREPLRYAGTAAAIGASAIAFEVAMLAIGVIVVLALIAIVSNYLGILSG